MDAGHPYVSVIVPCKSVDNYAEECVRHTLELDYPSFEVILLADFMPCNFNVHSPKLSIIPTEPVLKSGGLSPEEVKQLCDETYKVFLSRRYVLRRLLSIRSFEDLKFAFRGARKVIDRINDFK